MADLAYREVYTMSPIEARELLIKKLPRDQKRKKQHQDVENLL